MGVRTEFVNLLRSQTGYHEGHDSSGWNNIQKYSEQTPGLGWSDGQPWCAVFEAWGAWKCGIAAMWPMTASCSEAVNWWQDHGRFSEYPVLGGPLYMGPDGGDHTETVFRYDADQVWSVGGNTNSNGSYQGDGVYEHVRPRRGEGSPYGYGVPAYPEGAVSADPHLGGTASAAVPTTPTPPPPEDDMTPAQAAQLAALYNNLTRIDRVGPITKPETHTAGYYVAVGEGHAHSADLKADEILTRLAVIETKLGITPTAGEDAS